MDWQWAGEGLYNISILAWFMMSSDANPSFQSVLMTIRAEFMINGICYSLQLKRLFPTDQRSVQSFPIVSLDGWPEGKCEGRGVQREDGLMIAAADGRCVWAERETQFSIRSALKHETKGRKRSGKRSSIFADAFSLRSNERSDEEGWWRWEDRRGVQLMLH